MKCTSSSRGSTSASRFSPFTVTLIWCFAMLLLLVTVLCQLLWTRDKGLLSARSLARLRQRPLRQLLDHRTLVLDRPTQIGGRVALFRGYERGGADHVVREDLAPQRGLGASRLDRHRIHRCQTNTGVLADALLVERDLGGHGGGSVVADLALQLDVGAAAAVWRDGDAYFGQNLVLL